MIQKEEGRTEYEKISSDIDKVIEEGIKKNNKIDSFHLPTLMHNSFIH